MEALIQANVPSIIKKYKLNLPEDEAEKVAITEQLSFYIYNLVFNLCALIATVTSIHDPEKKKVKPRHIQSSLTYVQNQCYPQIKSMKGGSYHVDSEYFGKDTSVYQENVSHHVTDTVDFATHTARDALPSSFSGGATETIFSEFSIILSTEPSKKQLFPSKYLRDIFLGFEVTIKENSLDIVKQILKMHLNCLMYDVHQRGKVTLKKLEETVHLSRHAVFL